MDRFKVVALFGRSVVRAGSPRAAGAWAAGPGPQKGTRVGGIDFGFRNPFAAVWGTVQDGVLWLTGEHYSRGRPLSHHASVLPRDVMWYADPSGATERAELTCAGLRVYPGDNELGPGIAAVSARLADGGLRVVAGCCPNLLREAQLTATTTRWAAARRRRWTRTTTRWRRCAT